MLSNLQLCLNGAFYFDSDIVDRSDFVPSATTSGIEVKAIRSGADSEASCIDPKYILFIPYRSLILSRAVANLSCFN